MKAGFFLILILCLQSHYVSCMQHHKDTVAGRPFVDTASSYADPSFSPNVLLRKKLKYKSPWLAGAMSLIVPGAGQIYNGKKHYWKFPAYLAGIGLLYLAVDFNQKKYEIFREGYNVYLREGPEKGASQVDESIELFFTFRDSANLLRGRDFYLSQREFWVTFMIVGWAINVLDAFIYAHLSGFDVGQRAKLFIRPKLPRFNQVLGGTSYGGISIALNF